MMDDLQGYAARERSCLLASGADAAAVLQGVVTNDVERLGASGILYAGLLTPQGKYLFDFFLVGWENGSILIDVAADRAAALTKRLTMYGLRRDVRLAPLPDLGIGLAWIAARAETAAAFPAIAPIAEGAVMHIDPRMEGLGVRVYASDPAAALAEMGTAPGDQAAYAALRVRLGVPETGIELLPEESYPLEAGFERLHGVDFRKGCYVGQEVTARMKHKTTLRKGLVRVAVDGTAPPGTEIRAADGRTAGTLFTQADGAGLAHLRLDRAQGVLEAGPARVRLLDG